MRRLPPSTGDRDRDKFRKAIMNGHILFQWLLHDCGIVDNVLAHKVARRGHTSERTILLPLSRTDIATALRSFYRVNTMNI